MRYRRIRYNSAGLVFILENCFLLLSGCGWECSETDCTAGTASRVLVKTGPRPGQDRLWEIGERGERGEAQLN